MLFLHVITSVPPRATLRGLNFADLADLGKIAKLGPDEKFATGHPRN